MQVELLYKSMEEYINSLYSYGTSSLLAINTEIFKYHNLEMCLLSFE
jgi:hypothetical protein